MSAKEKDKKLDSPSKKSCDAASDEQSGAAAFAEGVEVKVRSAGADKNVLAAKVIRVHRSGELSVKYIDSGEIEKYVKLSRVQRSRTESTADATVFEEGDAVLYQRQQPSGTDTEDEVGAWRDGVVKTRRKDGSYDIRDAASEEIARKVPASAVKKAKKSVAKKTGKGDDGERDLKANESEEKILLAADAPIEFKNKQGVWSAGRVYRVRSDGTFDVAVESDSGGEEAIVKRVELKNIRKLKRKKKSEAKAGGGKDGSDGDDAPVRRRKGSAKKGEKLRGESSSDDSDVDTDSGEKSPSRRKQLTRAGGARFTALNVNQIVQFPGKNGRMHRGRIKLLRKDDDSCDIEHDSDSEVVSKRVPVDEVQAVSALSRLISRPTWMGQLDPRVFQLNARVMYRTKDGFERKAVVVKVWRDSSKDVGPVYDIEDILDGTLVKKIAGSKLRAAPWINYSLPQLNMSGIGFSTSLFSTVPRKGMKVRFRLRSSSDSARFSWEDGVIVRAKSDATCIVEYATAKGAAEQVRVKNGDIQTRFLSPFSLSNPLKDLLPVIEMPTRMYAADSSVEVSSGAKVYLGTVVSSSEQDRTYVVLYSDGRKEKNVSADRVRLSLRKLRIGTEVEMIVEGPCKEVSKLDGEVAWVHRDEKVAVRINGGNNDVFAQVCSHALMVDGKPAFAAPLSSTWLELCGFYLNLSAEALIYAWLCFGLAVEMGEMVRLFSDTSSDRLENRDFMAEMYAKRGVDWSTCELASSRNDSSVSTPYLLIPGQELEVDRAWLVALLTLKALLTAACAGFAARLMHSKIMAIQDNYIDVKEYQLDQVRHRRLGHVMGGVLAVSYLTLVVYASLLNRFEAYCLLQASATAVRFDAIALRTNLFALRTEYATTVDLLLHLAAKTTLNLFRAMGLHVLVFAFPVSSTAFLKRVLLMVPSVALAALLCALGVAALHVFYFVQKMEVVRRGELAGMTSDVDWAMLLVFVTLWLNASLFSVVAAGGRYFEARNERAANSRGDVSANVLEQAERGEFGLQAKREVLLTKVEQLQEQLGVCKLSAVRIHSHGLFHLLAMALGIYAHTRLRGSVESGSESSSPVTQGMTFHLAICVLWLMMSVGASLSALTLKQETRTRELWSFLHDV
ncbi:hypothetical protein PybrP1_011136 [[Pythium] brassicae (nom. inval.)]|nr:hypothetical protein PybrP1_011136 [[Pythium] brassicae (nom. inval.)]